MYALVAPASAINIWVVLARRATLHLLEFTCCAFQKCSAFGKFILERMLVFHGVTIISSSKKGLNRSIDIATGRSLMKTPRKHKYSILCNSSEAFISVRVTRKPVSYKSCLSNQGAKFTDHCTRVNYTNFEREPTRKNQTYTRDAHAWIFSIWWLYASLPFVMWSAQKVTDISP